MKKEMVIQFLCCLGIDRQDIKIGTDFINSPCPLAFFSHKNGKDTHPSFSIHINDRGNSYYYCFTCSPEPKSLACLIHNWWLMRGIYPKAAAGLLCEEFLYTSASRNTSFLKQDIWVTYKRVDPGKIVLHTAALKRFPLLWETGNTTGKKGREYLCGRGIPVWVQHLCKIRYWSEHAAIIFPLTLHNGEVAVLRARSVYRKNLWTITNTMAGITDTLPSIYSSGALFNLGNINMSKPVMLVEGELDVMRLIALGYTNVLGTCTAAISVSQLNKLCSHTIILGMDNDAAGRKANYRILRLMKNKAIIYLADWSLLNKKDANELASTDELQHILDNLTLLT
jgi:5S rRNA maturation endonuclease (ribonuclease M5)